MRASTRLSFLSETGRLIVSPTNITSINTRDAEGATIATGWFAIVLQQDGPLNLNLGTIAWRHLHHEASRQTTPRRSHTSLTWKCAQHRRGSKN
jgi:hypothetical protein